MILLDAKICMIKNNIVFIDTNILVYAKIRNNPLNKIVTNKLNDMLANNKFCISRQIIREYLSTMTKQKTIEPNINKFEIIDDINRIVNNFLVFNESKVTTEILFELIKVFDVGGKQIHDANIVATMLENNIKDLFTHNVKDFERYKELINIIPLV